MIALCENLQRYGKSSSNPRALLDATVVRLALVEKMADVDCAARRVGGRRKKKVASGTDSAPPRISPIPTAASAPANRPAPDLQTVSTAPHSPDCPTVSPGSPPPHSARPDSPAEPPRITSTDPEVVWKSVLETVGQTNAAAWMDHFRLQSVDVSDRPGLAVLVPTMAFAGGVHNVATGPRVKRVTDTLTQILAHPMRVEVAEAPSREAREQADARSGQTRESSPQTSPNSGKLDRRDALSLPMVRDVFDIFPNATLIDARREIPPPPEPSEDRPGA